MEILELFSGTESFSNVARSMGHTCFTIDNDPQFNPDWCTDISALTPEDIPFLYDIIWASPPCQAFSVAAIGKNWDKDTREPKTDFARFSIDLVKHTLELIHELDPKYYFIENPRGMLRKLPLMQDLHRDTVTYCQYGDTRMKPTDIWHNCKTWTPRPACKNGAPCHESAPRGSRTGTQGIKGAKDRSRVPEELCREILEAIR